MTRQMATYQKATYLKVSPDSFLPDIENDQRALCLIQQGIAMTTLMGSGREAEG